MNDSNKSTAIGLGGYVAIVTIVGAIFIGLLIFVINGITTDNNKIKAPETNVPTTTQTNIQYRPPTYTCDGIEYTDYSEYSKCQWRQAKTKALAECNSDPNKFDCWYDEYPGTTVHWSYYTSTPTTTPAPSAPSVRSGAVCNDGWISSATGRGACSHHGGVRYWR